MKSRKNPEIYFYFSFFPGLFFCQKISGTKQSFPSSQNVPGSQIVPVSDDPKTALLFTILCCSTTQEDFRLPIACISPDFLQRPEKSNRSPILPIKSRYCTFFI